RRGYRMLGREVHPASAPVRYDERFMLGVTRSFRSFSDALEEVVNARVFAGIHVRTAWEDGTTLGKAVAQHVLDHMFQGVR
ncbi:MAG: hypothetical protein DMG03_18810, partial [Acidobacteria bacterium]